MNIRGSADASYRASAISFIAKAEAILKPKEFDILLNLLVKYQSTFHTMNDREFIG